MINKLRDMYLGKSIAVLGSAPSIKLFQRLEDIIIGVNGAGKLLQKSDYFLSADQAAHKRSWFLELD